MFFEDYGVYPILDTFAVSVFAGLLVQVGRASVFDAFPKASEVGWRGRVIDNPLLLVLVAPAVWLGTSPAYPGEVGDSGGNGAFNKGPRDSPLLGDLLVHRVPRGGKGFAWAGLVNPGLDPPHHGRTGSNAKRLAAGSDGGAERNNGAVLGSPHSRR